MGRASIKENKNKYQLAREELGLSREKASDLLEVIPPERIEKIENERSLPHPDEVLAMSQKYKKPSLCNYYCSNECPIGKEYVPEVQVKELSAIVLEMLASLNSVSKTKDRLIEIAADGVISNDEIEELDLIVFTEKAVFILEVKNPTMDVVIDERGNYCRVRDGKLSFDKNVGERMNDKDFLLRQVLQAAGIENPNIVNLMVFTNNNIQVTNKFPYIQHCFLSSLPHLVDCYEGEVLYSQATISKMVEATEAAKCPESYPLPLDIVEFKQDFANLMVALEGASEEPEDEEPAQPEHPVAVAVGIPFWRKIAKVTATVIPVFGVAVLAAFGMSKAVKG